MVESEGRALFLIRSHNRDLEALDEIIDSEWALPGLGDAGASELAAAIGSPKGEARRGSPVREGPSARPPSTPPERGSALKGSPSRGSSPWRVR
jgi:hypothetical protein